MSDPFIEPGQGSQCSIGLEGSSAAFVYGSGAGGAYIANTQTDTGSLAVQDQAVVGHDGILFGVDTQPGMVITQTGQIFLPEQGASAMDSYSILAGHWNDPAVRLQNNVVQVLRVAYPFSDVVRRCYGRGRKIMPTYGLVMAGLVPFVAQFQASDNTWYEDVASTITLSMVPSFTGGLAPPMTPPYQISGQDFGRGGVLINTGSLPTWPVFKFSGPLSFPSVAYTNTPVSVGYNGILKSSDILVIDTRPWARTALLNGASVAGALTGSAMIAMQLQPGSTQVLLSGQDFTGTSQCSITWRNATLAIGGVI